MTHPSHFFDPAEDFISSHPGEVIPLAVLNKLVVDAGCPAEQVDSIINGVVAGIIQSNIAPKNKTVTTTDAYGRIVPDNRSNPTKQELVQAIVHKFDVFSTDRACKLVNYLIQTGVLICDPATDSLYLQTPLVARSIITL